MTRAPALLHAARLCAGEAVTAPRPRRRRRRRWPRRLMATVEFVLTAIGVLGAGLVVGVGLAVPS